MSNRFTMWMSALMVFVFCAFSTNAQTTLLTEDFENWPLTTQGWSFQSLDPATGASITPPAGSGISGPLRILEVIPLTMIGGQEHQVLFLRTMTGWCHQP